MIHKTKRGMEFIVDDADAELILSRKWTSNGPKGYETIREAGRGGRALHRILTNAPPELDVDHINGNTKDNRRANIRLCRHDQNMWNRKKSLGKKSKYKGVSIDHKKWRARITLNRKVIALGHYKTEEDAALAYDAAARKLFGEFCRLNFPAGAIALSA